MGERGAEGEEMTARAENSGKLWTAHEDERLRELAASSATPSEIAAKLNRTEAATKARGLWAAGRTTAFQSQAARPVEMGLKSYGSPFLAIAIDREHSACPNART